MGKSYWAQCLQWGPEVGSGALFISNLAVGIPLLTVFDSRFGIEDIVAVYQSDYAPDAERYDDARAAFNNLSFGPSLNPPIKVSSLTSHFSLLSRSYYSEDFDSAYYASHNDEVQPLYASFEEVEALKLTLTGVEPGSPAALHGAQRTYIVVCKEFSTSFDFPIPIPMQTTMGTLTFDSTASGDEQVVIQPGNLPAGTLIKSNNSVIITTMRPGANRGYLVSLMPVEIDSRDRAVTGKIPHLGSTMGGNKKFEIGFQSGSKSLGKYEIPQSGSPQGVKIYNDAESDETGIFGDSELIQANSPPNEIKNQQVVLTREGGDIRFYTVADNISTFKVHLYLDGSLIGTVDHQLKADSEFEKFIAAIEGFVAGDDPRGIGRLPTPILAAAPTAPQPTSEQTNNMLAMLPATLAAAYPGPTEASAWTSGSFHIDAESFRSWIRTIKDELTVEQWTPFAAYVTGIGYNVNGATGPVLNGWNAGAPPDGEIQLPGSIRNRGLVAKVLIYWLKKQMEMGVSTGKGVVFGLWDGVKSDWEGVVDILKMPVQLYEAFTSPFKAASELYNTFKVLKGLTLEDVKGIAKTMFDEFLSNQEARLAWPEPAGASDALKGYMGGYLGGYIGEQVAIAFLTAGGGVAVKAGKYIRTIIEKVRQGVKIVGAMTLIEGRLPKVFTQAIAKVTSDEDILRRIRAVSSRVKSVPMQARFSRSCIDELSIPHSRAAGRLDASLGGVSGDNLDAHHLIPWQHRDKSIVQKAARGGFNMNNGGHNGVLLDPLIHRDVPGHPNYNDAVENMLDALEKEAADLSDEETANLLIRSAGLLRMTILNSGHPLSYNEIAPDLGPFELESAQPLIRPLNLIMLSVYAMG